MFGSREDNHSRSRQIQFGIILICLVILVVFGLTSTRLGLVSTVTTAMMYVALTQGWNILGGYAGYVNLGMAAFFGIGAYASSILFYRNIGPDLTTSWQAAVTISTIVAAVSASVFALIIGIPSLRLRGPYFTILTLIIGFLVQTLANNMSITRGAMGIIINPLPLDTSQNIEQAFYFLFFVLMVISIILTYRVEHSKFGYALVAIREDEDAAAVLGVRTTFVKMMALLIGALLAGICGGIYAYRIGYVEPSGIFSLSLSINVVLMCVVGGSGTWQGPLIGVPLITIVSEVLRVGITRVDFFGMDIPLEVNRVVFGLILVTIALFAQNGIVGIFRQVRGRRVSV